MPSPERQCPVCGTTFRPKGLQHRACGETCRRVLRYGRRTCLSCGESFAPANTGQKYCSVPCTNYHPFRPPKPDARTWKGAVTMRLTDHAMRTWGFVRDPWADEPRGYSELFFSAEHARLREYLLAAISRNDAVAVSAPVGWGKTFLWLAIREQIEADERMGYLVVEPGALKKSAIDANCIQRAILRDLDVEPKGPLDSERLTGKVIAVVKRRAAQRKRIIIMIDEAHRIADDGLRALKNLLDIRTGFQRVLSVILLGQEELAPLLARESFREVGARIQIVRPGPLSIADGEVRAYIRHRIYIARCDRAPADDRERDAVAIPFDESGLAAVEIECTGQDDDDHRSMAAHATVRPDLLTINAICSHSMAEAADLGLDVVTQDVVHQARAKMRAGV